MMYNTVGSGPFYWLCLRQVHQSTSTQVRSKNLLVNPISSVDMERLGP